MKYIISIAAVTFAALVYVHQQIEAVKLSYAIDNKEKRLEYMLDQKCSLEYNINNLSAPSRLERTLLSRKIDLAFPKRGQIVRAANAPWNGGNSRVRTAGIEQKINRFGILEFFGLRAEAQAKEK